MSQTFDAYQIRQAKQPAERVQLSTDDLGEGDLLVRVTHSSLNYKDGLAVLGKPGVVRTLPMICGIDLAGEVVEVTGDGAGFKQGDQIVLTGDELSETRQGGFSGYQRVRSDAVVAAPAGLGTWGAMAVGTGGFTAALCVLRLGEAGLTPEAGPVLVTGATGGVGTFAVAILAKLGYEVQAVTGKSGEHDYLRSLGAGEIIDRSELSEPGRPLGKERWAAAVDSVGGVTLANVLAQTRYAGLVAACGLAGGHDLPSTVMPFILRNISLLGVDSVHASREARQAVWDRLDGMFTPDDLRELAVDAPLGDLPQLAEQILGGKIRGRVVINVQAG